MGCCLVAPALGRLFYMVQANSKGFVNNRFKWYTQFGRNSPCALQYIIVYCKRRSHVVIIASYRLMSRHHPGLGLQMLIDMQTEAAGGTPRPPVASAKLWEAAG